MKTFENYMKAKGVELQPWQKEAAEALLTVMRDCGQEHPIGKTFLMQNLSEFIDLYGNAFKVSPSMREQVIDQHAEQGSLTEFNVSLWGYKERRVERRVRAESPSEALTRVLIDPEVMAVFEGRFPEWEVKPAYNLENLPRLLGSMNYCAEAAKEGSGVARFARQCFEADRDCRIAKDEVYVAYLDFCERNGQAPASESAFRREFSRAFGGDLRDGKTADRRTAYVGIRFVGQPSK